MFLSDWQVRQVCAYELGVPLSIIRVKKGSSIGNANSITTGSGTTSELNALVSGGSGTTSELNALVSGGRGTTGELNALVSGGRGSVQWTEEASSLETSALVTFV